MAVHSINKAVYLHCLATMWYHHRKPRVFLSVDFNFCYAYTYYTHIYNYIYSK